jgi:ankyrin repeat protein
MLIRLSQEGSTALHFAVASGQTELLEGLLAAGCPVGARDNADNTPLHIAAGAR